MTTTDSIASRRILLELCAASVDDVATAVAASVDRIELNSAFPVGGLTPTLPLLEAAVAGFSGPVITMIRPREGGFTYSSTERRQMYREAELLLSAGAAGIAVGFLTDDFAIDDAECRRFRETFPDATLVFHRAFDLCDNLIDAGQALIDCGFDRILTGGGTSAAVDGIVVLTELIRRLGEGIEVLPAGGIRAGNVARIVSESGAVQIHSAARGSTTLRTPQRNGQPLSDFADWSSHSHTSVEILTALRKELDRLEQAP